MFLNIERLLMLCMFLKELSIADSSYGTLTDLGKSKTTYNLSDYEFSNCSLYNIAYGSSCTCFECTDERCTICCNSPGFKCCYCHACLTTCWNNDWQLISVTQVGMSTALLIATVATIALFFRICSGGFQLNRQAARETGLARDTPSRVSVSSVQQYVIERLQDRPPQYNDFAEAPPLYDTDPANRVATVEAPPQYTRRLPKTESTNESEHAVALPAPSAPANESTMTTVTTVTTVPLHTTANHM